MLSCEYMPLIEDTTRCKTLAEKAMKLAKRYDLKHCLLMANAALGWCQAHATKHAQNSNRNSIRNGTAKCTRILSSPALFGMSTPITTPNLTPAFGFSRTATPGNDAEPSPLSHWSIDTTAASQSVQKGMTPLMFAPASRASGNSSHFSSIPNLNHLDGEILSKNPKP